MSDGHRRVICLGFFDGLHIGHSGILSAGVGLAKELGVPAAVLTFDRHPMSVITGEKVPLLSGCEERIERLSEFPGISEVILLPFDMALAETEWEDFFESILLKRFKACGLVCGFDYSFGAGGRGHAGQLEKACRDAGIKCKILPAVEINGIKVSSTHIRMLIAEGRVDEAEVFLGRPVAVAGRVEEGRHIGRKLGFPTINMQLGGGICAPRYGVYLSEISVGGDYMPSITNIGMRPTIPDGSAAVETHILGDFEEDAYGKTASVRLLKFLRDEMRFETPGKLRLQVEEDIGSAEKWFYDREGKR